MHWLTLAEVQEEAARHPDNPLLQQLLAALRDNQLLRTICADPRLELQAGDKIICGESVCTVQRVEGDQAWFEGTHFGKASFGGRTKGWCKRTGAARIVRRGGQAFYVPAELRERLTAGQDLR